MTDIISSYILSRKMEDYPIFTETPVETLKKESRQLYDFFKFVAELRRHMPLDNVSPYEVRAALGVIRENAIAGPDIKTGAYVLAHYLHDHRLVTRFFKDLYVHVLDT